LPKSKSSKSAAIKVQKLCERACSRFNYNRKAAYANRQISDFLLFYLTTDAGFYILSNKENNSVFLAKKGAKMLKLVTAKRLRGFLAFLFFLIPILAHAQKPGSFYWGDSDMDGIISGNDYATLVSVYMDNTQDDAGLYFGYPQSRYRQDLDGDGLISGADISFLESWFVGDWNTYGAPTTLEWAGPVSGLTVGNLPGDSVAISAISYSSAGTGHWPRTGFGIIFAIDPTSQCASTAQIYGFDPAGGATVWAWRNPLGYDYQPTLVNPELGIAAVKVRGVGCALGSIIRLTAYIPADMEYLIPGQRNPARLTISSPTILEITVGQPSCLEITSVSLSPYNPTIQENDTISFIATCTLEDESQVDCTESYCGRATAWSAVGVLTQLTPPNLFIADIGAGLAWVFAYAYNSSSASYPYLTGSADVTVEDVTPPETTITSQPPDPSSSPDASFEFECNEASCTFECQIDSGGFATCSSPQSYFGLVEGNHTFEVRAIDNSSNVDPTPASYTWAVDTPPDTIITSNPPDPTNQTSASFAFDCTQPPCTYECSLDLEAWESCSSPKSYPPGGGELWTPTSLTNAPSARQGHTMVWTGSEMIVWGGAPITNTGGRYDPATDSWTATSTTNAPSARRYHVAVWTGSLMIVWGGYDYVNTGGRYDPATDTWAATSLTNAPQGRQYHTAVWTGSEMIVWGGRSSSAALNTGGQYNPSDDTWTATSTGTNVPQARWWPRSVWTGTEMIAWGGWNGSSVVNTGGRYDPLADSWVPVTVTNAPSARQQASMVWTGSKMLVWGGDGAGGGGLPLNTGGRYDPLADSWTVITTTNAPSARIEPVIVWTGTRIIVWGGSPATNTGGKYDPVADSWGATGLTNAPSARRDMAGVWTGDKMIVWGGNGGTYLNTGGIYQTSWLAEGEHNFSVRAYDAGMNVDPTPASYTWTVDFTTPVTTITSGPLDPTTSQDAEFQFICNEIPCTLECSLDYGAWEACVSPKDYLGLTPGYHVFEVRATDAAGNTEQTPALYTWFIDLFPPETFISAYPADPTNLTSAYFEFDSSEPGSSFECSLDAGAWEPCTSPAIYDLLLEGPHDFQARATDPAGNTDPTPASYSWTIDLTPPDTSITSAPPDPSSNNFAIFTFSCSEAGCAFQCNLDAGGWSACASPVEYFALANGAHNFQVRATDPAGNTDPVPAAYNWTINAIPPETTIISMPADPSNVNTATFEFICSTPPCTYECRMDGGGFTSCESPKNYSNLLNGSHTFEVRGRDEAGNTDMTPASYTWVIDAPVDTILLTYPPDLTNSGLAQFTFTCTVPPCTYECSLDSEAWAACISPKSYGEGGIWTPTSLVNVPPVWTGHSAVWTGTEMIVWGGGDCYSNTGGRYNPVTDSWTATSTVGAPSSLQYHTAVWTGSMMITWAGYYIALHNYPGQGGRYYPATDSWQSVPGNISRNGFSAVWTGNRMIIYGGIEYVFGTYPGTALLYDPVSNSWSKTPAATGRSQHTAVWTGTEMIIWGGHLGGSCLNTGARYNQGNNSWTPTSTTNAPSAREYHSAVWTGSEMIVWGGFASGNYLNTGGRYNPVSDSWLPTSVGANVPSARADHVAVWTGSEMIVWGGDDGTSYFNTGGKYNPIADAWNAISLINAPTARSGHTAVWTGEEMIAWGGYDGTSEFNTGGRYYPDYLSEGSHNFSVRAYDAELNVDPTPASFDWTIDRIPPDTFINAGPDSPTSLTYADFEFACNEPPCSFECRMDDGTWSACSPPQHYEGLSEGGHTFQVRATDLAGNLESIPASYSWIISNCASLAIDPASATIPELWSAQFRAICTMIDSLTTDCTAETSFGVTGNLTLGPKAATQQVDASHIPGEAGGAGTVTGSNVACLIPAATPASVTLTNDEIVASLAVTPNPATVDEGNTIAFAATCTLSDFSTANCTSSLMGTSTSWTFTGALTQLTPPNLFQGVMGGGTATVTATFNDGVNPPASDYSQVDVINLPPETIITSNPPDPTGSTEASFEFICNEPLCTFVCRIDGGMYSSCSSPQNYSGLVLGTHNFQVRAIDGGGTYDPSPASYTWTIVP